MIVDLLPLLQTATKPSEATLPAFLEAEDKPFLRSQSIDFSKSSLFSAKAFTNTAIDFYQSYLFK